MLAFLLLAFSLAFSMGGKEAREAERHADSLTSGITGRVEIWEGNFMPMIEPARAKSQIKPAVGRRVRVYEAVRAEGGVISAKRDTILTPLVAETVTDTNGHFSMAVAPGTYSIFVEDESGWYNNGWNSEGIQGAVVVEPDQRTDIVIKITTKATF